MIDEAEPINREAAIAFLEEASRYFANRNTGGEDRAHWANVFNSINCKRIVRLLREDAK